MDDKQLQEIALFRFSLIAPAINETFDAASKEAFYRQVASKMHTLPNGEPIKIAPKTLKKYYLSYMHDGFDGLIPKRRIDKGCPRVLSDSTIARIVELRNQFPHITGTLIYQKLIEEGTIKASDVSLSSILRYIKAHHLTRTELTAVDRRAFEMAFANDMWQADTSHGAVIKVDGIKKQTYLIAIIDDASRIIVHGEFFFEDNALNLQICLKKAVNKHGVPKRLFVDNGKTYKNDQLGLICASLGTVLIHSRPYSPQSKGKIERSFRTVKDGWLNGVDWNQYTSLETLNADYNTFLNKNYNNQVHSALKDTPRQRYLKDSERIKYLRPETIDEHFLHRITRKVNTDATITLYTVLFEVPMVYMGKRIAIRYFPGNLSEAYIFEEQTGYVCTIYPLARVENSKVKRKEYIDYTKVKEGKANV